MLSKSEKAVGSLVALPAGSSVVKNPPAKAGNTGSIPDPRRAHMLQSNSARAPTTTETPLQSPGAATIEAHTP